MPTLGNVRARPPLAPQRSLSAKILPGAFCFLWTLCLKKQPWSSETVPYVVNWRISPKSGNRPFSEDQPHRTHIRKSYSWQCNCPASRQPISFWENKFLSPTTALKSMLNVSQGFSLAICRFRKTVICSLQCLERFYFTDIRAKAFFFGWNQSLNSEGKRDHQRTGKEFNN